MSRRELCRALARGARAAASQSTASATPAAFSVQSRRYAGVPPWPSARSDIARAHTPPNTWYTSPSMVDADAAAVFNRSWLVAGRAEQVAHPGSFFTGSVLGLRYVCVRGDDGVLRAFHNFCRHNAASVASGEGTAEAFQCPYHGWTYDLRGRLRKATRLAGIQDFSARRYGLVPLRVEAWGHYVMINAAPAEESGGSGEDGAGEAEEAAAAGGAGRGPGSRPAAEQAAGPDDAAGGSGRPPSFASLLADAAPRLDCFADPLKFLLRKEYHLKCDWKVFCNNYLDGGYHVPWAHKGLAAGIDMGTYTTEIFSHCSLQSADTGGGASADDARLGSSASYVFAYPNIMVNRYGPWMDSNIAVPTGPGTCAVLFDYFIDPSHPLADDRAFIAESLAASEQVQREDIALCEDVQLGLRSPGYVPGRYAPRVEGACFHFHQMLEGAYREEERRAQRQRRGA